MTSSLTFTTHGWDTYGVAVAARDNQIEYKKCQGVERGTKKCISGASQRGCFTLLCGECLAFFFLLSLKTAFSWVRMVNVSTKSVWTINTMQCTKTQLCTVASFQIIQAQATCSQWLPWLLNYCTFIINLVLYKFTVITIGAAVALTWKSAVARD